MQNKFFLKNKALLKKVLFLKLIQMDPMSLNNECNYPIIILKYYHI